MASWKKTITTPFRKAATLFNHNQQQQQQQPPPPNCRDSISRSEQERMMVRELQGQVMACGYEDVLVMWSLLDKSSLSSSSSSS